MPETVIWQHGFWIGTARQLPPAPPEVCAFQAQEREPGWEAMKPVETIAVAPETIQPETEAPKRRPGWIYSYFTGNDKDGWTLRGPKSWAMKLQSGPVARIDRHPEVTIKRLTADIFKDEDSTGHKCNDQIGKRCGDWTCVATDGRRALLVRGLKGTKGMKKWPVNDVPKLDAPHFILHDAEIMNGLLRLEVVLQGNNFPAVRFTKPEHTETLILSAKSEDMEGTETYSCSSTLPSFAVALNPSYILPALGMWPMIVYFKDAESPVIFMPKTRKREFMYVVMPTQL